MRESIIRTAVPMIVTLLLGWAARIGLGLDSNALALIVTAVIGFLYYTAARFLEQRWPLVGKILLSAGLVARQPVYAAPGAKVIQGRVEHTPAPPVPGPAPTTPVQPPPAV